MELKSLTSDGYMYVPQAQTGDISTLFLPCIMRYAAKPSLGCRLPITIHPSNLIHAIQTHRSYPPYPISHSQGLRKRSLQNIHSSRSPAFASAHRGQANEGSRFGHVGGVATWPKALVGAISPTSKFCMLRTREPPFYLALWTT